MANPTPISIPKTVSSPADPSTPLYLTTLPPEIRNRIIEELFRREHGVFLIRSTKKELEQIEKDTGPNPHPDLASLTRDERYQHSFGESVAFLRACWQIYHGTTVTSGMHRNVVFDLASQKASGWNTNVLHVCKKLRLQYLRRARHGPFRCEQLTFLLTPTRKNPNPYDFGPLKNWLTKPAFRVLFGLNL
jgi:hypothetical protein